MHEPSNTETTTEYWCADNQDITIIRTHNQQTPSVFAPEETTESSSIFSPEENAHDPNECQYTSIQEDDLSYLAEAAEASNINHLPTLFLGVNLNTLGYVKPDDSPEEQHAFFQLKTQALNPVHSYDDRTQALRTLCLVPIRDSYQHLLQVAKALIDDPQYNVIQKFTFFAQQSVLFRLPSVELIHNCHKYFFEQRLELKPPTNILLLNIRQLLQLYNFDDTHRWSIMSLLIDMLEDASTTTNIQAEIYDIFITHGCAQERLYGEQQLAKLGGEDNYTNQQSVHTIVENHTARSILTNLRNTISPGNPKEYLTYITSCVQSMCETNNQNVTITQSTIDSFIQRISLDSTQFDGLNLLDITYYVLHFIETHEHRDELQQRFIEEIKEMEDVCTSGYMIRLVNVLQGYAQEEELQLKMDPEKECRYATYARLRTMIQSLPSGTREEVLESLASDEPAKKQVVEEFILYYWDDSQLIHEYKGILSKERVREIADEACKEFILLH